MIKTKPQVCRPAVFCLASHTDHGRPIGVRLRPLTQEIDNSFDCNVMKKV